jgi:hypothetical protein
MLGVESLVLFQSTNQLGLAENAFQLFLNLRWNVDVEIVSKMLELGFLVRHVDNDVSSLLVIVISDTIAIRDLSKTENVCDQIGTEPNISPSGSCGKMT